MALGLERRAKPSSRGRVSLAHSEEPVERDNMVASASMVDPKESNLRHRLHQAWQDQSLAFYDITGVCSAAADFYGKAFGNIRFFPARRDERGQVREITDDQKVLALWSRIKDRSGSMKSIQRAYGRLQFLIGDGYLTVSGIEGEEELWEYLSPTELRWEGGKFVRAYAPGVRHVEEGVPAGVPLATPIPDNVVRAWRMYQPHPRHSLLAHSSMQSVLDDFEELVLLTAAVRARVKSRLASAGILLIPDEITFPGEDPDGDEDPDRDILMEKLMQHMITPILQEGTASAVVPFFLRASVAYLDSIRHLKLHDPNETYREVGLRLETIKRIAIGVDLPPEMLLGMGDLNHWVGWLIDEQFAKSHIFPGCDMFANDLASAYLRPVCKEEGVDQWQQIAVGYDPAELVVHPDASQNAKDVFDRGEIGGKKLRDATGFTEEDAPTPEERDTFLAIKLRDAQLLVDQPENQPVPPPDQTGGEVDQTPPDSSSAPATQPTMTLRSARLIGAAEFTLTRARSLAGSRLRPKIRTCDECLQQANGTANHELAAALGEELVQTVAEMTARDLVKGAGQEFAQTAQRWKVPAAVALALGEQIEAFAAKTLYLSNPEALPPGFDLYVAQLEES